MYIKFIVLITIVVLHFLTPHWFLNDFLKQSNWFLIIASVITLAISVYKRNADHSKYLSSILTVNILVYFLTTAQVLTPDVGDEKAFYRLKLIVHDLSFSSVGLGRVIEIFNFIQLLLSLLIMPILIVKFFFSHESPLPHRSL